MQLLSRVINKDVLIYNHYLNFGLDNDDAKRKKNRHVGLWFMKMVPTYEIQQV